jgi:multimeric flavodoxin WrbA
MIIGICGSPRKGATEYVLHKALGILEEKGFETIFFSVRNKNLHFCQHCDYCIRMKKCRIQDDMKIVDHLFETAKGVILASPSYNGGITAQIKTIMDRSRALVSANNNVFKNKFGMAILVGGDRNGGQELGIQQIITFYLLNGIIPVSGGAFGANLGATFWSKDTLEGVKEDQEGFRTLQKTCTRFAEYIKKYSNNIR